MLELRDVSLHFGRNAALAGVNLQVAPGEWLALVGPNASGKSSLLRCAAGLQPPSTGAVTAGGEPVYPVTARTVALPGYAAAPDQLPGFLTIRQSMEVYASAHGLQQVPAHSRALVEALGLAAQQEQLNRDASLGTRQKLAIVLSLMLDTPLLLLDEVFNGLDARSALALKRHLRERVERDGLSIVLATHALDVVATWCDGAALLDAGRLLYRWDRSALRALTDAGALEQALADVLG